MWASELPGFYPNPSTYALWILAWVIVLVAFSGPLPFSSVAVDRNE
jgi:hypothetical protein